MATATPQTPLTRTLQVVVPAVAAGADKDTPIGIAPFAGVIAGVSYIPVSTLTGANTDSRTCSVINKGAAGSGTTNTATQAFTSTHNATGFDETAIPLSGTAANLDVASGDVLNWNSLHVGSTGLADPGGLVVVTLTRA